MVAVVCLLPWPSLVCLVRLLALKAGLGGFVGGTGGKGFGILFNVNDADWS